MKEREIVKEVEIVKEPEVVKEEQREREREYKSVLGQYPRVARHSVYLCGFKYSAAVLV